VPSGLSLALKLNIYGQALETPFDVFAGLARQAEETGFGGIFVVDHLYLPPDRYRAYTWSDPAKPYFLDAWSVLAAIAAITHRVRIGPQVSPLTFRHPSLLARAATTVDLISNGRLVLQLGTGWHREEHTSFGLEYDDAIATRVERLTEGIEVIRGLMGAPGPFSYAGKHFQLTDAPFWPKPVQRPAVPIWLGGSTPKSQRVVAEHGDGWTPAMPQGSGMGATQYAAALASIRTRALEHGRDPDALEFGIVVTTAIAEDRDRAADLASVLQRRADYAELSLDELADQGALVWGTPDDCFEALRPYVEAGARTLTLNFVPFGDASSARRGMELYAAKVLPRLAEL
jgi:probable F420-dependent oxidoreductase